MTVPPAAPTTPHQQKSQTEELYDMRTEENLGNAAKIFRDRFIVEYSTDFHGPDALIRCGYAADWPSLKTRACQLLREPYVKRGIAAYLETVKEDRIVTRRQILQRLWLEANTATEGSVRVAALNLLAKMTGCIGPTEDIGDKRKALPTGVMYVPVMSLETWSAEAGDMQTALKLRAKSPLVDGATGLRIPERVPA